MDKVQLLDESMLKVEGKLQENLDVRRYFQDCARGKNKRERVKALLLDAIIDAIASLGLQGATIKERTDLLFYQMRDLQSATITRCLDCKAGEQDLVVTCEAILRLLGRTFEKARSTVEQLTKGPRPS